MSNSTPGYGYPNDPNNPYGSQQQPQQPQQPYGGQGQSPYGQQGGGQPYGYPQQQPQSPYGANQQAPYAYPAQPQYGMPGGAPGQPRLATSGDRFLARLIDALVLVIPLVIIELLIANPIVSTIVVGIVWTAYEAIMMVTQGCQTVGKKVMKIRVVDSTTFGAPTEAGVWTRAAVYGLPMAVYCIGNLFYLLNVLWHLWDQPLRQCLHDKIGKTVVIKEG